jgi:hypothetical protein
MLGLRASADLPCNAVLCEEVESHSSTSQCHAPLTIIHALLAQFVSYAVHVSACAYYFIAREFGFGQATWIGANTGLFTTGSTLEKYIFSVYWSVTTLATVGYGSSLESHETAGLGCGLIVGKICGTWAGLWWRIGASLIFNAAVF